MNETKLEKRRDRIYRRTKTQRVKTMNDAAQFIDNVGFCLLFASAQNLELPSLFEAVKGRRDVHIEDWDADSERVWVWKNDLPATRRAYYGKALGGGKPVFVALKYLPAVYALAAPENLARAYARGEINRDAKRLYDALAARGPTPTMALRAAAGFENGDARARFQRALDELQRQLLVAPIGAVIERGAWASQIFELTARWFPREIARAQKLNLDDARRALAQRYLATVVACAPPMLGRVFGWSRASARATMDTLIARGVVEKKSNWLIVRAV